MLKKIFHFYFLSKNYLKTVTTSPSLSQGIQNSLNRRVKPVGRRRRSDSIRSNGRITDKSVSSVSFAYATDIADKSRPRQRRG